MVAYIHALGRDDIRIVDPPGYLTLGNLRNIAVDSARGEIICQWDDDDLYHPDRLTRQLQALRSGNFEAVYLQEVIQYFPRQRALYWTNWRATEAGAHPGTLMAWRDVPVLYPTRGEEARLGEDLCVALSLKMRGGVLRLDGQPHLFIYVSHGANSWRDGHHDMLAAQLAISRGLLLRREAELRENLRPFRFESDRLEVRGNNGLGFEIQALTN